jgi:hypothetical protein
VLRFHAHAFRDLVREPCLPFAQLGVRSASGAGKRDHQRGEQRVRWAVSIAGSTNGSQCEAPNAKRAIR